MGTRLGIVFCAILLMAAGSASAWASRIATPPIISSSPQKAREIPIPTQPARPAKLLRKVNPKYPPEAKKKGIQGAVRLRAVIGKDGHVRRLRVVSGAPILVKAAVAAVRQWVYEPTLLNGKPVEVTTFITVEFTLAKPEKIKGKHA